jgi:hypothetical protein
MRYLLGTTLTCLCLSAVTAPLPAQTAPDRPAILSVVHRLFDGMRRGDSAMVRSTFHPRASLTTAAVRQGKPAVLFEEVGNFVQAVGAPHDSVWDERISNEVVLQDGTLAVVWTDYRFYVGDRFSHCGVDAFTLAKEDDAWKIVALTDTRRRQGCD